MTRSTGAATLAGGAETERREGARPREGEAREDRVKRETPEAEEATQAGDERNRVFFYFFGSSRV